jgi:tetratricopeptide (TPR) repeat protein
VKAARRFVVPAGLLAALAGLGVASGPPAPAARQAQGRGEPEAVSLLGRPLFRAPAAGEALAKLEGALQEAAKTYAADPASVDNVVLYGRALAALWRYNAAIDVYSQAIAAHPDNAVLYRHRGHRYISVRKLDAAVTDLARAAELRSDDFDIWYHLGLAHFLKGEFALAEPAYRMCLEAAKDEGSVIAVANWLYHTLRRQSQTAEAAKVLGVVREGMDPGENAAYYDLLLFFRGLKTEAELEKAAGRSDLDLATIGYGLGCWHLAGGAADKAFALFERVLAIPYWPAFGYIAAEAEVQRAGRGPGR